MLSRTADHVFWMARYIERAENTARMLDASLQMALLPRSTEAVTRSWRALLGLSELEPQFQAVHSEITPASILEFMIRDASNPSSIYSCLRAARENARAVRGTLTSEVWETHNATWLELCRHMDERTHEMHPTQFLEWVKFRSHQSRGVTIGTMLKDEAFYFARMGTFLERADNTARILDVKFFEYANDTDTETESASERQQREFYHWGAVLRAMSAYEIYRKVYRDIITQARVAELLMLRADMPRSLLSSMNEMVVNLEQIRKSGDTETERHAGLLRTELHYGRIDDFLVQGLHSYLSRFLQRVSDLGERISRNYLVPLT